MTHKNIKGIDEPPKLLGVRGRYLAILFGVLSTVTLAFLFGIVILFLSKNTALAFFMIVPWAIVTALVYGLFVHLSDTTPFKGLKEDIDLVSHHNLLKFLR